MKSKKIVMFIAIIVMVVSPPFFYLSRESSTPTISFNPSSISNTNLTVGSTFTVALQVSNAINVWGWGATITWNASILQLKGTPVEGPFLKSAGSTAFIPVPADNDAGILDGLGSVLMSNTVSASGDGNLTYLTFSVKGTGSCQIRITSAQLVGVPADLGSDPPSIPVTVSNATFSNVATPNSNSGYGPKASFTPFDGSSFGLGSTIQLDASSSTPGYDTVNGTETCPITTYAWRIEYLNGTTFTSLFGQNVSFTASAEGNFRITLIVIAVDPHLPSDSGFTSTDSASAIIEVVSNPYDTKIDVFTDRGGVGSGVSSGEYGPLDLVQMYSSIIYHNSSVVNQNVLFTIKNANASVIAVRQGVTNGTGIASAILGFLTLTQPRPK